MFNMVNLVNKTMMSIVKIFDRVKMVNMDKMVDRTKPNLPQKKTVKQHTITPKLNHFI